MNTDHRIPVALLLLRVSVFLVFLMWTLDKLVNPGHAEQVFARFYLIGGLGASAFAVIGGAELVLLRGFLAGYQKRWTYGAILLLHGIATLSSFRQYLTPFSNLLYFAAWPMLAACFTLYVLRDLDTHWVVPARSTR